MRYHIYKNAEQIAKAAAAVFVGTILEKPDCVLGLATGSTPLPLYRHLVELNNDGLVDFEKVKTFNLDEYIGLTRDHEQSYYRFMQDNLFAHINIKQENIHVLNGMAKDPEEECRQYEQAINTAGGIDVQLLGIGHNGHIAFNEPGTAFTDVTGITELTQSTIEANTRFFEKVEDVPCRALTTGIGTIMRARKIVIIATGADKAPAVHAMLRGAITPQCPASILQYHPCAIAFLDEAAASML